MIRSLEDAKRYKMNSRYPLKVGVGPDDQYQILYVGIQPELMCHQDLSVRNNKKIGDTRSYIGAEIRLIRQQGKQSLLSSSPIQLAEYHVPTNYRDYDLRPILISRGNSLTRSDKNVHEVHRIQGKTLKDRLQEIDYCVNQLVHNQAEYEKSLAGMKLNLKRNLKMH